MGAAGQHEAQGGGSNPGKTTCSLQNWHQFRFVRSGMNQITQKLENLKMKLNSTQKIAENHGTERMKVETNGTNVNCGSFPY